MRDARYPARLILCLATIYLVWGSSFLFTKIAMQRLPPAMFSGTRFLTAGCLLAVIAHWVRGEAFARSALDWRHVTITGFCMVFLSNGLNTWAIGYIPSNVSALLNGTSAFWIAGLGMLGPRGHPLSRRALAGICIGFGGAALMLIPKGGIATSSLWAEGGTLAASCFWALGTLYFRSIDTRLAPLMFMALQMCMGGLMLLGVAFLDGEAGRYSPDAPSWIAWCYLTFFSSCLAYTAYGWLSLEAPPVLTGTYGYVNPAIAAYLGWQFLGEKLSAAQLGGMVVVIAAVVVLSLPGETLTESKTLQEPAAH